MTIAVSCCLADGAIVGADSAITLSNEHGILKVYNDAEKIFPLFDLRVGLVAYGLSALGARTIKSYALEFELDHDVNELRQLSMADLATELWLFFRARYDAAIGPALEEREKRPYDEIPPESRPMLGIHLVGYSPNSYLPEAFQILPMIHDPPIAVQQLCPPGAFGARWAGQFDGIARFHHGYDNAMLNSVTNTIREICSTIADEDAVDALIEAVRNVVRSHEKRVPFQAMPLRQGIDYVNFLLDIMIGQHHFVQGAPTCGGPVRIAIITPEEGYKEVTDHGYIPRPR